MADQRKRGKGKGQGYVVGNVEQMSNCMQSIVTELERVCRREPVCENNQKQHRPISFSDLSQASKR